MKNTAGGVNRPVAIPFQFQQPGTLPIRVALPFISLTLLLTIIVTSSSITFKLFFIGQSTTLEEAFHSLQSSINLAITIANPQTGDQIKANCSSSRSNLSTTLPESSSSSSSTSYLNSSSSQQKGGIQKVIAERADDDGKNCDLFTGEWVLNPEAPYYDNKSCYIIPDQRNCIRFGRPDSDYLRWKWKPDGNCNLP